jgi:secreted trypsin-like serine protease
MKFAILVLSAAACFASPFSNDKQEVKCGVPAIKPDTSTNIEGGKDAIPYSWPWQAALFWNTDKGVKFHCAATLLSNDWVMAAGHCVFPPNPPNASFYHIKLGTFDQTKGDEPGSVFSDVSEVHLHPKFNKELRCCRPYDVALLKLSKPVKYTDHISPICLPTKQDEDVPKVGTRLFVTGWGLKTADAPVEPVPILQQITAPIVDTGMCDRANGGNVDGKSMFCAGETGKHACKGDSGGPALYQDPESGQWKQIGITGWFAAPRAPAGCPGPNNYNVFAKISASLDFIKQYVKV